MKKEGNSNHHERFHGKRANISGRYDYWKIVAIFEKDVPKPTTYNNF